MDIRTLCLGILSLGEATGYEIKKLIAEGSFSFFSEASYGSIYPALTKLTDEGLIECYSQVQTKRPDKKIYRITNAGREVLENSLTKDPKPDKNRSEFLATLLFTENVAPDRIGDLIDQRCQHHELQIAQLSSLLSGDESAASKFVISYGIAMQKAALEYLQENKDALSQKISPSP